MKIKPGDLVQLKPVKVLEAGDQFCVVDLAGAHVKQHVSMVDKILPRAIAAGDRVKNTGTQATGTVLAVHGDSAWFLGDADKKRRTVLVESLVLTGAPK